MDNTLEKWTNSQISKIWGMGCIIIERKKYLEQLISRMDNGMIKVITGIRRCGKSYLLFNLFCDYLIQTGVKEDAIITISLDDIDFSECCDPLVMNEYIKSRTIQSRHSRTIAFGVTIVELLYYALSSIRNILHTSAGLKHTIGLQMQPVIDPASRLMTESVKSNICDIMLEIIATGRPFLGRRFSLHTA